MTRVYHRTLPDATSKICSLCGIERPLDDFSKDRRQGRVSRCKICKAAPRVQRTFSFVKTCYRCKVEKSLDEFAISKEKKDGRCSLCKACKNADFQRTKEQTKEKRDAYAVYYHQTHYEENREKENARCRKWHRNNPEWAIENVAKRRARLLNAAIIEKIDYNFINERDNFTCHICGKSIDEKQGIHYDHVIPLVRGGCHTHNNIKMSHATCNLRKGKKLMEELTEYKRRGV